MIIKSFPQKVFAILYVFALSFAIQANAYAITDGSEISEDLAMALVSGRSVVAKNQTLINNPDIGDKGLTSEIFIKKMSNEYKARTGKDLLHSGNISENKVFKQFIQSIKEILNEAQPVINKKGEGFKGFIPASFGLYVGEHFKEKTGITLKQTSHRYRNRANKPDGFEDKILTEFEKAGYPKGKDYYEVISNNGTKVVRYMKPLYVEHACLMCHGEPAGEYDITGRKKEGYREGDLRGAISVVYPFK